MHLKNEGKEDRRGSVQEWAPVRGERTKGKGEV
jgi:hypothetical protein